MLIISKLLNLTIDGVILDSSISSINLNLLLFLLFYFSGDIFQKVSCSLFKKLIRVYIFSLLMPCLTKSIHIQLSYERCKISVFEVTGKNLLSELADTFDDKRISFRSPTDNLRVLCVLNKKRDTSIIS